jgi:cyclopropane-fatty-acyl-phospholipid synthase
MALVTVVRPGTRYEYLDVQAPFRQPAVAAAPSGPVAAASAIIANQLLRRAAARLPLRLVYPDGTMINEPDQLARRKTLAHIGFGEVFARKWELYLAHAEAGFRSGYLNVCQWSFVSEAEP